MGKHKIVKSAAAVALTASVVATAAAPGASAASYKVNSKDQLVYSKSGKLVKGWKVFGGKLYKNGKLAPAKKYKIIGSGAARQLFYGPTLKKGYKTAINKTLLFKDGKLADGWKQAGKNERLYKNGKLDKGYTVYTDVEGEKFLYQNGYLKKGQKTATRGGETLLFVDGKLAKGYVLHEASKTLYNNGKVAKGLVQYPEKDGKFYNDGKLANGEINGAEYKDGVLVAKDIASVKAINDTTVEVTFKKDQKDVKASDFKIEGLEVKNAATKQGDDKIVILTTSKQEAAKEYTLVYKETDTKTFTAKSAVIPTAITTSTASVQGTVGKEVTLKAQVTVAEGQSKAGIPVTFNIDGAESALNKDIVAEAYTDENGVATYSYTQYNTASDAVAIYATGKPADRALAKVYWGVQDQLTVVENDTKGATLANGDTKQYKVTYLDAKTGKPVPNTELNVTFAENIGVTADKISNAKVKDTRTGAESTPYQLADGTTKEATVKTDENGVAIFTVSGTNTKLTPIVFKDVVVSDNKGNGKLDTTELQAQGTTVTFQGAQVNHQITLTPVTEERYASVKVGAENNGRTYKLKVLNAEGKAYAGGVINLAFNENLDRDNTTVTSALFTKTTKQAGTLVGNDNAKQTTIKLNEKGEAEFTVYSTTSDSYATPVAWIDQNNSVNNQTGELDNGEPSFVGDVTYFQAEAIKSSVLTVTDDTDATVKGAFKANQIAKFKFDAANQSGNIYSVPTNKKVTYTVKNTGAEAVLVSTNGTNFESIEVGGSQTFTVTDNNNFILVKTAGNTDASVSVSANGYTLNTGGTNDKYLGTQSADVTFAKYATDSIVTGAVTKIDATAKTLEVTQSGTAKAYNYGKAGSVYQVGGQAVSLAGFENVLVGATITATKDADGNVTYNVINAGTAVPTPTATLSKTLAKNTDTVTVTSASSAKVYVETASNLTLEDLASKTPNVTTINTNPADLVIASLADGEYTVYTVDSNNQLATETLTIDTTAPTVVSSTLDSTKKIVTVTFSEDIKASTLTAVTGTVASGATATVSVTGKTATITYNGVLAPNDTVTIADTVTDLADNTLAASKTLTVQANGTDIQ